jgi:membrane protease YdiL (CAAX protease family)
MNLDRFGRLREPIAFLSPIGPRDRNLPRLVAFLLLGVAAAFATALLVGLAIVGLAALELSRQRGLGLLEAVGLAVSQGAGARSLLSYWFELGVAGLASYAGALAVLGLAKRFYRRSAMSFLTEAKRFRWPLVGLGVLVGATAVAMALVAQTAFPHDALAPPLLKAHESLGARIGYIGLAAACLYLAALAEEIIFRGVLLQLSGAFTRSLPLILVVNGLLFSLAHFDPDPSNFVIRALMGVGWAWIALRTGGIETTSGIHLANNLMISLFIAPVSFQAPKAKSLDPAAVLIEFATVLVCVAAVEWVIRRRARAAATRPSTTQSPAFETPGG